jgi:FKBP-type peptidyl-prolyl cis-trans isomerase
MKKNLIIILIIIVILIVAAIYFSLPKPNNTMTPIPNTPEASNAASQNQNPQTTGSPSGSSFDIQGMKVEILKQGTGDGAKSGDSISVNYTGSLPDGTKFDSSVDPSFGHVEPFTYTLGQNQVIQGWELGLLGMKKGEERKLTIPPELGYGASGSGTKIPANATLVFDITMLSINGK